MVGFPRPLAREEVNVSVPAGDLVLAEVRVDHRMEVLLAMLTVYEDATMDVTVAASILLDDDHMPLR